MDNAPYTSKFLTNVALHYIGWSHPTATIVDRTQPVTGTGTTLIIHLLLFTRNRGGRRKG